MGHFFPKATYIIGIGPGGGGGGGGGTLILSCIHRFGTFFGLKLLNLNIFRVFRTMNIFGGFQNNEYFWGSSQNLAIFRGHSYAFWGLFLRSRFRMGDVFSVAKISNIFWGWL